MVKKELCVYLLAGQDPSSKDSKISSLKAHYLSPATEEFNLDVVYGRDTTLKGLQERLKALPYKSSQRVVLVREADRLKEEVKEFLAGYTVHPYPGVILILDVAHYDARDSFLSRVLPRAQLFRFKEEVQPDTFTLSRQIDARRLDSALRILGELLRNGEKPERILGGLRHSLEHSAVHPPEMRRKLKALLACDLDIKTGKLRPDFALERLLIRLCAGAQPGR